jgi:hypothetical protein
MSEWYSLFFAGHVVGPLLCVLTQLRVEYEPAPSFHLPLLVVQLQQPLVDVNYGIIGLWFRALCGTAVGVYCPN